MVILLKDSNLLYSRVPTTATTDAERMRDAVHELTENVPSGPIDVYDNGNRMIGSLHFTLKNHNGEVIEF